MTELTTHNKASEVLESRRLSAAEFQGLAELPPEVTWFANIRNPNTRRAYEQDLKDFSLFIGIRQVEEYQLVTRAHVIAWRHHLEGKSLSLPPSAASSRPCRPCSTASVKPTRLPTIQ